MSEFNDVILLECNRKESIQANTDNSNNGIWTNRMGDVVQLDIGDTVELKSAFINQRGCANPNSLEFKGESLGVTGEFIQTSSSTKYPDIYFYSAMEENLNSLPDSPYDIQNDPVNEPKQGNLAFRQLSNDTKEIDLVDNELNLEINFYKTSNGEQTIMQPRCYIRENYGGTVGQYPFGGKATELWTSSNFLYDMEQISGAPTPPQMQYIVGSRSGHVQYEPNTLKEIGMKRGDEWIWGIYNSNDYHEVYVEPTSDGNWFKGDPENQGSYGILMPKQQFTTMKPRNDNSKFTLFEREYDWMVWGYNTVDKQDPKYMYQNTDGTEKLITPQNWYQWTDMSFPATEGHFPKKWLRHKARSPALFNYLKRTDMINIKLDKGFSTPQAVAEQITEQLQAQNSDSPYQSVEIDSRGTTTNDIGYVSTDYSINFETKLFKPVSCATGEFYNKANWSKYWMWSDVMDNAPVSTEIDTEESFNWWRSHHNILVKRPDLFEVGRRINTWLGYVQVPDKQPPLSTTYSDPLDPDDNSSFGTPNYIQNTLDLDANLYNDWTSHIVTSWVYNEHNLKMLQDLFDVQGKYPELFQGKSKYYQDNIVFNNRYYPEFVDPSNRGPIGWLPKATIDNSRFLHCNRFDVNTDEAQGSSPQFKFDCLGNDNYTQFKYTNGQAGADLRRFNCNHMSAPFFFKYDKTNHNKMTSGDETSNLSYGFATKQKVNGHYYITLHPELCNGLRPELFVQRGGQKPQVSATIPGDWDSVTITPNKCIIGWDYHFNSWGNVVMLQDTGIAKQSYDGEWSAGQYWGNGYETEIETYSKFEQTYIGANNPACVYDTISNRFGWEYLHIPERIGNKYNSGSTSFITGDIAGVEQLPIIDDAGTEVYKINKRLHMWIFNSDMCPYVEKSGSIAKSTSGSQGKIDIDPVNHNLEPWVIYDSQMGVMLNFGKSAKLPVNKYDRSQNEVWNNSVLGIMGFSYEQFNPTVVNALNNQQSRVRYDNIRSLYNPSTNSQIVNTDANQFIINPWGATQYTTQLPYSLSIAELYTSSTVHTKWGYLPAISQQTQSIKIEGVNLPKVILKPYLTVRTDLISKNQYIGGTNSGLCYPIIAVINKINAEKDYIQLEGSEVFTVTQPVKFSSITTAICDPSGEIALLGDGSAVIYKINKLNNLSHYDIIAQIQQEASKKPSKKKSK